MTDETDPIVSQLPALRRYALALTRDPVEAEDLVQDALLRGHERRRSRHPGDSLRAWLMSILRNRFLDRLRHHRARQRREGEAAAMAPQAIDAPQDAAVRLAQLRDAFMDLPPEQREALTLVAIEGLSYAEAAEVAGVAAGTIMSRVARARARLRSFEDGRDNAGPALKVVGGRDAGNP